MIQSGNHVCSMKYHQLIVLRHGKSQGNQEDKFCGWLDIPLSEKGMNEAQHAGELINKFNLNPKVLFTSKLSRSIKTGYIILDTIDKNWLDHYKAWQLNERHYGIYQGRKKYDVFVELGQDKQKFQYMRRDINGCPPLIVDDNSIDERYEGMIAPRGESLQMVIDRVIPYLHHQILPILEKKSVIIVTHGSVVRSLIYHFTKVSDDQISKINIPTGVPITFDLNEDGYCDSYQYLDDELAKKRIAKVEIEGLNKSNC